MRGMAEFLAAILDKRREAEAHEMQLDLIVLHQDFYGVLMQALGTVKEASAAFELRQCKKEPERRDIYLHGVKVMWSGNRLPARQAWYRYSNPKLLKKAA